MTTLLVLSAAVVYVLVSLILSCSARTLGYRSLPWFIASIVLTPIISVVILFCLGEEPERKQKRLREEEDWKREYFYLQNISRKNN